MTSVARTIDDVGPASIWLHGLVGAFVLLVGTSVYLLDRPAEAVPFFSAASVSHVFPSLFGRLGESLPTFSHVFGFSVLTAIWLGGGRRVGFLACLVWFGIDTALEVGQHPRIAVRLVQVIPDWFERLPILDQTDSYFLSGTFDGRDLISIALGATIACVYVFRVIGTK